MPYIVARKFRDKESKEIYSKGDSYSHDNEERIAFLIEKGFLEEKSKPPQDGEFPLHTGGGYYQLTNGEKVQGKEAATQAQEELDRAGE